MLSKLRSLTGLVERWGRDVAEEKLFRDKSRADVAQVVENFCNVIEHPRGYHALNQSPSGKGRPVSMRVLYLALGAKPGRLARFAGYSVELQRRPQGGEPLSNKRDRRGKMDRYR